ncbi:MAG: hypothetical protein EZS26_002958 [Candidatus Ordinivivax streblomastigis]|uniref:Uncharacterized protein n=1 Tax=Candidatus Ordinivivax streblomastigis TaxID=2540710 RepID=A0A5M8NYL4_9BACT|nr:MAG: hypothetical protein EZS26_002958 [Candidatus Ordinivivax streblomastigis]
MKARGFKIILMMLAAVTGFSAIVMLLWNALLPDILGWTTINFWQALGLLVLIRILFGGIGGGKMWAAHGMHHDMHGGLFGGFGKGNPIREKWMKMSPEERKEFVRKRHEHMHRGMFGRMDFFGDDDFNADDRSHKNDE